MGIAQYKHLVWITVLRGTLKEEWKLRNVLGNCLSDWGKKKLIFHFGSYQITVLGDGPVANRVGRGGGRSALIKLSSCALC